jgi:hypothetical protein
MAFNLKSTSFTFLAAVLFITGLQAATMKEIGKIERIGGPVEFDPFGTDKYVAAEAGDYLYRDSRVRTFQDSFAVLLIGNEKVEVPPVTLFIITEFLALREKAKGIPWYTTLSDRVAELLGETWNGEKPVALGTEANRGGPAVSFLDEGGVALAGIREAKDLIGRREYGKALLTLYGLGLEKGPDEALFLAGYCHFMLGDYRRATMIWDKVKPLKNSDKAFYPVMVVDQVLAGYLTGELEYAVKILGENRGFLSDSPLKENLGELESLFAPGSNKNPQS